MQNNTIQGKTLAEKLFNSANTTFSEFQRNSKELKFVKELSERTYYENYIALFYTAIFFAYVAQIASAVSSYNFFYEVLGIKLSGLFLIVATITILILIEVLKYVLLNKSFSQIFTIANTEKSIGLLIVALALSIISITASVLGGGKLGIDTAKVTNVESKFDSEITALRNEIQAIQKRNSWKGQTYIAGKEKALLHTKELELAKVKEAKENGLQLVQNENQINESIYRYGFGIFEAMFILCTCYIWYFKKRTAIEFLAGQTATATTATVSTPVAENLTTTVQTANVGESPRPRESRIGFTFSNLDKEVKKEPVTANTTATVETANVGNGNRICLNCETVFVYKIHNQKFCCETCRISSWEAKTGKRVKKGKK